MLLLMIVVAVVLGIAGLAGDTVVAVDTGVIAVVLLWWIYHL